MISVMLPDVAARWGTPSNKFANTFVRLSDFVMWRSWFKKKQAHVRCRCRWKLRGWAKIRCRLIVGFERSVGVHCAMPCLAPSFMFKFNQYAPKKIIRKIMFGWEDNLPYKNFVNGFVKIWKRPHWTTMAHFVQLSTLYTLKPIFPMGLVKKTNPQKKWIPHPAKIVGNRPGMAFWSQVWPSPKTKSIF